MAKSAILAAIAHMHVYNLGELERGQIKFCLINMDWGHLGMQNVQRIPGG